MGVGRQGVPVTTEERRLSALTFAASLRGARERGDAISWMEQHGFVTIQPTVEGDVFELTEAGIERADEMIAENEALFR
jgi:hypothetical protein